MNRVLHNVVLLLSLTFILFGCSDDEKPEKTAGKTVIVYMAADNSLNPNALKNIKQMEKAYTSGNLIVYADPSSGSPRVYKIKKDQTEEIGSEIIREYEEHNSVDPETMRMILSEIMAMYPSESYGLVLWSHGTAWYPAATTSSTSITPLWFGEDKNGGSNRYMDITDLADALPSGKFEYVIFDACLMGTVEVAYELRNKADYLLASPTVIISDGFPYADVTPMLLSNVDTKQMLQQVGRAFYEYYNAQTGQSQTGNIALIDLAQMNDLALTTKELIQAETPAAVTSTGVQRLCYGSNLKYIISYDFLDFLEKNFTDEEKLAAVKKQLGNTVIYKEDTGNAYGNTLSTFCGLGSFIPGNSTSYTTLNNFYKTLGWCSAAGYDALFSD